MKIEDKRKQSIRRKYNAIGKVKHYIDVCFFITLFLLAFLQVLPVLLIIIACYLSFVVIVFLIFKLWEREAPGFILELKIEAIDDLIDELEVEKQELIDDLEGFEYD